MKWRRPECLFLVPMIVVATIYWWQRPPQWFKPTVPRPQQVGVRFPEEMMLILGGTFDMGSNDGPQWERPVHEVTVRSFWMDKTAVTVGEFAKYVQASGYVTEAE